MRKLYRLILLCIISYSVINAQSNFTELNLQGKEALKTKNKESAAKLFTQSIALNKDADSYYQLAKLYLKIDDSRLENIGYEHSRQATLLEPGNLEFKYLYLDYLEIFGRQVVRAEEYWKIFNSDNRQAKALVKLAEIKFAKYEKFRALKVDTKTWYLDSEVTPYDLKPEVKVELDSAETLYLFALEVDSLNYEGLFGITKLYQSTGRPDTAIKYLQKISRYYPQDKDVHLQLGLYYYRKKALDEAYKEFQMAINYMGNEEREDFEYNSVIQLLEPKYKEQFKNMNETEKRGLIEKYWKVSDPLYLTSYNERIVEHYARVAYANLFFSSPDIFLAGWKTDRGQIYIRYGEPVQVERMRQNMQLEDDLRGFGGAGGIGRKTTIYGIDYDARERYRGMTIQHIIDTEAIPDLLVEAWVYKDLPGFVFSGTKNYFKLVTANEFEELWRKPKDARNDEGAVSMLKSRATINSLKDYDNVKAQKIQSYKPVLYGNRINLDNKTFVFNRLGSTGKGIADIYFAYSLPTKDTANINNAKNYTHEIGAFVYDQNVYPLAQIRDTIPDSAIRKNFSSGANEMVNCVGFSIKPARISFAFDARRMVDSNYFTYRKTFDIKRLEDKVLGLSDLVFTNQINLESEFPMGIKRGEISFYPKVNNRVKNGEQFYIYYEVYNLLLDEKKEGSYEQVVTIKPKGEEGISLKKLVKGITTLFTGDEGKVSLTSNYITKEENTQIYLQLDFSGYKPGKYELTITINDKVSGKYTERKTDLEIF